MLKLTPSNQSNPAAQAELLQRVGALDEWQARLVLSFINKLFGPGALPAEEMEVAA